MNPARIVGVVNATPDSFYEGSRVTSENALQVAGGMIALGADVIEVGGESTGPRSVEVPEAEELERVTALVERLSQEHPSVPIGIDTWKAKVAHQALRGGASIVNDVTAGRGDPDLFSVVARSSQARLVLMYAKDPTARTTVREAQYDDVVATIKKFLASRRDAAIAAGISSARILLDPGLGHFVSSDPRYSFEILARLREFASLGCPLFISPSRKSFLAGAENLKTADRLPGTIAASTIAALRGAAYIRTHDVLDVRRACEIAEQIRKRM